jgi:hypothetical protein
MSQEIRPDDMDARLRALAFNAVTYALGEIDRFATLTERRLIADSVVAAILLDIESPLRHKIANELFEEAHAYVAELGAAGPTLRRRVECLEEAAGLVRSRRAGK